MYIAEDKLSTNNPYLTQFMGEMIWGKDKRKAARFNQIIPRGSAPGSVR